MDVSDWEFSFITMFPGKLGRVCYEGKALRPYALGEQEGPESWDSEAQIIARTAPLPPPVTGRVLARGDLPASFAAWLFSQWLREECPRDTEELNPSSVASELLVLWDQFTRRHPVFRPVAPTSLGLSGGCPSLGPTDASWIPATDLDNIIQNDNARTAWYQADRRQVAAFLSACDRYRVSVYDLRLATETDLERWIVDQWGNSAPRWFLTWRSSRRAFADPAVMACIVPRVPLGPTLPCVFTASSPVLEACLLANLNSLCLDHLVLIRLRGADLTVKRFQELPLLAPDAYGPEDLDFIVPRVVELSFTVPDLAPWAEEVQRLTGLPPSGPFPWDRERRAYLKAELNLWFARLYQLDLDGFRSYLIAGLPDPRSYVREAPSEFTDDPILEREFTLRMLD